MWRIWNKLFGWDYIYWVNSADRGVARVYLDGDNHPYYFRYKAIQLIDKIERPSQVVWLTCKSTKYLCG